MKLREDIRNIAIIAHVDHGFAPRWWIIEAVWNSWCSYRIAERAMDSNDTEKERGITIP